MSRRGPIVAVIVSGVLALLAVALLVLPKMNQVSDARKDLETAKDEEVSSQAQLRALQDAQAQAPETEQEIRKLEHQVPPTAELPQLFGLLQTSADRSAVDFFQFTPGAPTPDASGEFSLISSQITVTGSYFALDEFLYGLETFRRAAKVMSIAVTHASSGGGTTGGGTTGSLNMAIIVEFYTTDASAGPGSVPGPTGTVAGTVVPPTVSPSAEPAS